MTSIASPVPSPVGPSAASSVPASLAPVVLTPPALTPPSSPDSPWWRSAVIYQIYPRSFADANGDGIGDIAGITSRLEYLRDLGVDAIWITPWYRSPMDDHGYDVADFRAIDPLFGTLGDAEALIADAHSLGLRVLLDIVPNHVSDEHLWFRAALTAAHGSAERDRFIFRSGKGATGELPPNNWQSMFGGGAWTRVDGPDGTPGEWYLHLFAPGQPDLNWNNPEVRDEYDDILRFWFDRGVDGFRIDVAHGMIKHPDMPDLDITNIGTGNGVSANMDPAVLGRAGRNDHPHWNQPGIHEIYRRWRAVADSFEPPRIFVAEAWVDQLEWLADYLRPDELHSAFNFDFLVSPWRAGYLRETIENSIAALGAVEAVPTWVLANHDVIRQVTRYGRPQPHGRARRHVGDDPTPLDLVLGTRRARAAALLMLALPGGAYVYEGEELGLWEVEDIPDDLRQDPAFAQSGRTDPGRDGCRVPIPWTADGSSFGFGPDGGTRPWLPQPPTFAGVSVAVETGDPESMLELYRSALHLRTHHPDLGDGPMAWDESHPDVLSFTRGDSFRCVVNISPAAVPLAAYQDILLASAPADDGLLAPDTAIWLSI